MALDLLQPIDSGVELRGIRLALQRIADALELAVRPAPASELPAVVECLHPVDRRIDFGTTDGAEDWQCGVKGCGYRSVPPRDEAPAPAAVDEVIG